MDEEDDDDSEDMPNIQHKKSVRFKPARKKEEDLGEALPELLPTYSKIEG